MLRDILTALAGVWHYANADDVAEDYADKARVAPELARQRAHYDRLFDSLRGAAQPPQPHPPRIEQK